jgi:polar amino acid transport system substrate-binding protein
VRPICGVALALALTLAACEYPRDVEDTLQRVEGGTMVVGVVDNPPWVITGGAEPRGVEPELVRQFAAQLEAEIEWVEGNESELVTALEGFQIDLLIGGLTRGSPFGKEVALTRPYVDTEIEFGVPPGEELPEDLNGVRIWVEEASEAAALLQEEEEETVAVGVEEVAGIEGPTLLETYYIDALGYERTDHIMRDDEHCMAVPAGENAFLVELEKFLLPRGEEAEALLERVAAREVARQEAQS